MAARSGCEVSQALGPRLGLDPAAVAALDEVYERWDGLGVPHGRAGDTLTKHARAVHVVEQAVLAHTSGGRERAVAEVRRRAGGHLDPALATAFLESAEDVLAPLDLPDLLGHLLAVEPPPALTVPFADVDRLCSVLAAVVDLKGRFLLGHSQHVTQVAAAAGRLSGPAPEQSQTLRCAALVHDLGRVVVSSSIWDSAGPLGPVDVEHVRLHPYWTERVLSRCPALAPLAAVASAHHERADGSGYHRGTRSGELTQQARLLAAADVFGALTEERPHRPAMTPGEAAAVLPGQARDGLRDVDAVAAVIEGAGLPRPRAALPAGLTPREVQVLRLAARGMTNREIAAELVISERTVGHHAAHVFDKTGRRTRAGVAVFAMEHDLLGPTRIG